MDRAVGIQSRFIITINTREDVIWNRSKRDLNVLLFFFLNMNVTYSSFLLPRPNMLL